MKDEVLARRLFKEQIRKELIDEIGKYQVGWVSDGEMIATKTSELWSGYIFVIPDEIWNRLLALR